MQRGRDLGRVVGVVVVHPHAVGGAAQLEPALDTAERVPGLGHPVEVDAQLAGTATAAAAFRAMCRPTRPPTVNVRSSPGPIPRTVNVTESEASTIWVTTTSASAPSP